MWRGHFQYYNVCRHSSSEEADKPVFTVSRLSEHLCLHTYQSIVVIVEDSVLREEMGALESQEEDAPKRILWYKPLVFLGVIRSHRRDESWSTSL